METEYSKIDGIPAKLIYAENPTGTVIAIHGFGGSKDSAMISALAERLCREKLCVLSFDLPCHGERQTDYSSLSFARITEEIIAAENYVKKHIGGELYGFATSFGGLCMLHRLEAENSYRRVVLRVPAVNMADSLVEIAAMSDPNFTLEKAKTEGFSINMGREYRLPFRFYGYLQKGSAVRMSTAWDSDRLLAVYAENDNLVKPTDTKEFLRLNPQMQRLMIKNGTHHISPSSEQGKQALSAAVEFLTK